MASNNKSIDEIREQLKDFDKKLDSQDDLYQKLSFVVWGTDGTNGLRSMYKQHEDYIQTNRLENMTIMRAINEIEKFKHSTSKLFWTLILCLGLNLITNWFKIRASNENRDSIKNMSSEVTKAIDKEDKK